MCPRHPGGSDAATLGGTNPIMRDRGDVADRGNVETHSRKTAQRAFATRARTLHFDFKRANAMFSSLLARIVSGNLRGIGGRLAAPLEAHRAGTGPADRIALSIGDGDHGVVEAGVDVRNTAGDVYLVTAPNTAWFACQYLGPLARQKEKACKGVTPLA